MATPKLIDLGPLTVSQLEELAKRIAEEIARKRAAGREWLEQHGARIVETDAPKYQNPDNAAQTWSGKGKRPKWVEEVLAQGHTLESLSTDDLCPVPRRKGGDKER
ncbi:MAG TPA: H-NS histone family protein [Myxococcota bacterium]|jgi:DNA-binding protein H-NS